MSGRRVIRDAGDLARFITFLGDAPMPFTVTFQDGAGRTLSQNGLVHQWFAEIAAKQADQTAADVKGQCNATYGAPILRRDFPEQAWILDKLGLNHEQLSKAYAKGALPCTSLMSVKQLSEYMDAMGRDYRGEGFTLTDPEAMKYQDTF